MDISGSTPHPDPRQPAPQRRGPRPADQQQQQPDRQQPDPRQPDAVTPSPGVAWSIGGPNAPESTESPADGSVAAMNTPTGFPGQPAEAPLNGAHLFGYLAVYSLLRIGLVVVLTAVLAIFMPLIVALLFAIIAQLPLAWLLFAGPRRRVNEAMDRASAARRAERARLQSALTGDVDPE